MYMCVNSLAFKFILIMFTLGEMAKLSNVII